MLHALLNSKAHDQGHWFRHCTDNISFGELITWMVRERKYYHPHFIFGRLKHKERKERCKWYVQGHPGRWLRSEKRNPHFPLHPLPLLTACEVSAQICVSLHGSMVLCVVVTTRNPHLHRCRRVELCLQLLRESSRERASVQESPRILPAMFRDRKETQLVTESSVRTTVKKDKEDW